MSLESSNSAYVFTSILDHQLQLVPHMLCENRVCTRLIALSVCAGDFCVNDVLKFDQTLVYE